jgi:hypothetical protein
MVNKPFVCLPLGEPLELFLTDSAFHRLHHASIISGLIIVVNRVLVADMKLEKQHRLRFTTTLNQTLTQRTNFNRHDE